MSEAVKVTMRTQFEAHQISKLPKPTASQTDAVKADFKKGIRCTICGGWHHPDVIHLDYVGHAALTDRMLDVDPLWNWEPLAVGADGYPVIDGNGGMWIKLTVLGVTRHGYGDAQGKIGGNAMKERIGDALRNAAMRFGAALDLWHKGDLHIDEVPEKPASMKTIVANDLADAPPAERQRLQIHADILSVLFDQENYEQAIVEIKLATAGDPTQVNILRGLGDKAHWKALGVYRTKKAQQTMIDNAKKEAA